MILDDGVRCPGLVVLGTKAASKPPVLDNPGSEKEIRPVRLERALVGDSSRHSIARISMP